MSTTEKQKAEGGKQEKKLRTRSPGYPSMSLGDAIEMARKLWNNQERHDAHIDAVLKTLGYNSQSGSALRAVAALTHYGLTDESGKTADRKIKLSERALDILLSMEGEDRKQTALRDAALTPAIFQTLWEKYGAHLPGDETIKSFLVREKRYQQDKVADLIENYRSTFELAKIDKSVEPKPKDDKSKVSIPGKVGTAQEMISDSNELPLSIGPGMVARIPFPMTEDDYSFLLDALKLYKKKLVRSVEAATRQVIPEVRDE